MGNFSRDGGDRGGFRSGGDRGGFKGGYKGGFGGGDRGERGPVTMHSATCSSCNKACEVPFRPTGEKPVYCRDCFAGRSAMGGERSSRPDFRKENKSFSPGAVHGSSSVSSSQNGGGNGEIKKQLEMMNAKLDKLVSALTQNIASVKPVAVVAPVVRESLKGVLKDVTKESKDNVKVKPAVKAPTKIETKMIAKKAVKGKKK